MTSANSNGAARPGAAYRHIAEDILVLTAGLGTGAGLMFLCDPNRGRARRSRLAAEFRGFLRRDESKLAKRAKDVLHRVEGLAAEAVSAFTGQEPVTDEVLIARVRARIGHVLSHPHEVRVQADAGMVTLEGKLTHSERRLLREEVKRIPGVQRINDHLRARSSFAPGLLVGIAAGLALLGKTDSTRTRPAGA